MATNSVQRRSIEKDPAAYSVFMSAISEGLKDQEIVDKLSAEVGYEYNVATVRRLRRKKGLRKPGNPKFNGRCEGAALTVPPPNLDDDEKAQWFRQQFKKSHLFVTLCRQFDVNEVDSYMQEYGQVCAQFQDIVTSEYFQIDDFLKHRILINRQLERMRVLQGEIEALSLTIRKNPPKEGETKEEMQARIQNFRTLDGLHQALNKSNERYDKLVAERQKIYSNLAATRRDRVDELKTSGDSFFGLLSQIQTNDKMRHEHGKYAELTRLAAEDTHAKFREATEFPDGTTEPVILDERTTVDDEEHDSVEDTE
jgi:hypothetical protein